MGNTPSMRTNFLVMGAAISAAVGMVIYTSFQNSRAAYQIGRNIYNAAPEGTGAAIGLLL